MTGSLSSHLRKHLPNTKSEIPVVFLILSSQHGTVQRREGAGATTPQALVVKAAEYFGLQHTFCSVIDIFNREIYHSNSKYTK